MSKPTYEELEKRVKELEKAETGRKNAEEELRASEEKYRSVFENTGTATVIVENDTIISMSNAEFEKLSGYTREEIEGNMSWTDFVVKDELERMKKYHHERRKKGGKAPNQYEFRFVDKNKIIKDIFLVTDGISGTKKSVASLLDITNRKRMEEALRMSEERFKDLAEMLPEAVFETDREINLTYANRRAYELFGYSEGDQVLGMSGLEFIAPKDRNRTKANIAMRMRGNDPGTVEYQALKKDGSVFPVLFHASPIMKKGKLFGFRGIIVDITEHKKSEETLKESEERLRMVVENMPVMMDAFDDKGTIIIWNRECEEVTGYNADEIVGNPRVAELLYPNEDYRTYIIEQLVKYGSNFRNHEWVITCKDGSKKTISWSNISEKFPIPGWYSWAIGVDVTERKQLEEERAKASKLESIGILAGGIAHDFNNILAAILGNISLAKMYIENRSEAEKLLSEVEKASLRAKDLTQQLLTFAKGGSPVKEISELPELIKETIKFSLRGSNVRYRTSIPYDLWPANIDKGQISQAVGNLVINAQQAMPEGGTINITVENVIVTAENNLPLQEGKYVKISIIDKGTGISAEHLPKIFDPYFTTKQKGSGLGLATTYSIIHRHDGHITVESEDGVGTTFYIYLPASSKEIEKKEAVNEESKVITGKILVMDDEPAIRKIVYEILARCGSEIEVANDGEEAIKLYKKAMDSGKPFDIVIMDLTIPGGMGGKDAIKKLLKIDSEVKAVISSGYADDPVVSNYKEFGFKDKISKPYKIEELKKVLNEVLSKGK